MSKSVLISTIVAVLALILIALFAFHITDAFLPANTPQPTAAPVADKLKIQDLKVGTGAAVKSGDTITVNYVGKLPNGQTFDSSYTRHQPFTTVIGTGQVIKGWDEGLIGMKVGGKRRLTIPPDLGYGDQAAGSIPPNSTLIFDIELLGIKQ